MKAIILAAGSGSKIFPYNGVRNKTLNKVANKEIIKYNLLTLNLNSIVPTIVCLEEELRSFELALEEFECDFITTDSTLGTSDSLALVENDSEETLILYGDTIIEQHDLERLIDEKTNTILVAPLREHPSNWIGLSIKDNRIVNIIGHNRGDETTHQFAAFKVDLNTFNKFCNAPDYFPNVKVGVSTAKERHIESAICLSLAASKYNVIETLHPFFDIDKPWHLAEASAFLVNKKCEEVTYNVIDKTSSISENANIIGSIKMGKNSYIGDRVLVKGSLVVGDNTIIDNGAIFEGNAIIGDNVRIQNYAQIGNDVAIDNNCIIDHCAEFLAGILMEKVYLYHYCEIYGIIGAFTDIGAATVYGTLRFDDGNTTHVVNGRRETPKQFSNMTFIGDYCRTGVNAIFMPGVKVGTSSIVGSGVILENDLPENTIVKVKQELSYSKWGANKYGW